MATNILESEPNVNKAAFANEVIARREHVVRVALREPLQKLLVALVEHLERREQLKELVLDSVSFVMEWREDGRAILHPSWKDWQGKRHTLAPKGTSPWG